MGERGGASEIFESADLLEPGIDEVQQGPETTGAGSSAGQEQGC